VIRPGDRVFVGSACATPRTLLRALEAMVTPVAGVQLVHFLTDGPRPNGMDVAAARSDIA
jgi:hypothetical protein